MRDCLARDDGWRLARGGIRLRFPTAAAPSGFYLCAFSPDILQPSTALFHSKWPIWIANVAERSQGHWLGCPEKPSVTSTVPIHVSISQISFRIWIRNGKAPRHTKKYTFYGKNKQKYEFRIHTVYGRIFMLTDSYILYLALNAATNSIVYFKLNFQQ